MNRLRDYLVVLTPGLFLLFFNYGNYWSWHWASKWTVLVYCFSIFVSWLIAKNTTWAIFPFLAISFLSSAYTWAWGFNPYRQVSLQNIFLGFPIGEVGYISLAKNTTYSYVALLMFGLFLAYTHNRYIKPVSLFLGLVFVLSCLRTYCQYDVIPFERGAFSGNASMNGCLIASTLPFLFGGKYWPVWVCMAITALLMMSQASAPWGVLFVSLVAYCTALDNSKKIARLILILLFAGTTGVVWGLFFSDLQFFNSSGRFQVWSKVFQWWLDKDHAWYGTLYGTTQTILPPIHKMVVGANSEWFMWMHSDWLQILFETGIVGFVSALIFWVCLAVYSYDRPKLFSSFMGFSACALFNYPLRLPIHATAITMVCWMILKGGDLDGKKESIR